MPFRGWLTLALTSGRVTLFTAAAVWCSAMLCRDFDSRVKIDLARLPSRRHGAVAWSWNGQPILAHSSHVKLDRPFDSTQGTVDRLAGRYTAREIGH
jgi:hypothetical protein